MGDDLPSYPGRPPQTDEETTISRRRGLLLWALAAAAVLLIGYAITRDQAPPMAAGAPNALSQAVEAVPDAELSVSTSDPARVRRFIRDEFGWRVGVPLFDAAPLQGVGVAELAPGVEVPSFHYTDAEGRQAVVFALSYALLDQVPDRLRLARTDYELLAADTRPTTRRLQGTDVVLWRDRDDIYVAVTDIPPAALSRRLLISR